MLVFREGEQTRAQLQRARNSNKGYRKTGITLEDRGVRDDNGLEPISGIFSSPEKSPPKRSETITGSESMDIQESTLDCTGDGAYTTTSEKNALTRFKLQAPFPALPRLPISYATRAHTFLHRDLDRL
jgi:centromere protein C